MLLRSPLMVAIDYVQLLEYALFGESFQHVDQSAPTARNSLRVLRCAELSAI